MKLEYTLLVLGLMFGYVLSDGSESDNFMYSESLTKRVKLKWKYDDEYITFQLSAPTLGWVGLGFSPGDSMAGADIVIAGTVDGYHYIFDCFAKTNGAPSVDKSQDMILSQVKENGTYTTAVFKRKLKTKDKKDRKITKKKMDIIWAFGPKDIQSKPANRCYHYKNRGHKKIIIFRKKTKPKSKSAKTDLVKEPLLDFNFVMLDEEKAVGLHWLVDKADIIFQITAPTMGWVGFGFSEHGSMRHADLFIAGGTEDSGYIVDLHSVNNGVPVVDYEQKVKLLGSMRSELHTTVLVKWSIEAIDKRAFFIEDGLVTVIWAYGKHDIRNNLVPGFVDYHFENKGSDEIRLITDASKKSRSFIIALYRLIHHEEDEEDEEDEESEDEEDDEEGEEDEEDEDDEDEEDDEEGEEDEEDEEDEDVFPLIFRYFGSRDS